MPDCAVRSRSRVLYQIKSATSTDGTVSSVTKTEGATLGRTSSRTARSWRPGADNGDVLFVGKAGAELEIVVGMATATLVTGLHVKLTVTAATTGTQQAALVTGVLAALALFSATEVGTRQHLVARPGDDERDRRPHRAGTRCSQASATKTSSLARTHTRASCRWSVATRSMSSRHQCSGRAPTTTAVVLFKAIYHAGSKQPRRIRVGTGWVWRGNRWPQANNSLLPFGRRRHDRQWLAV